MCGGTELIGAIAPFLIQSSFFTKYRGVAQLVARSAGGREVAGSSPVTPTKEKDLHCESFSLVV